jgi:hypothetical protein
MQFSSTVPPIDPFLLDLIACPLTKEPLRYDEGKRELISDGAGVAYPISSEGCANLDPRAGRILNGK